MDDARAGSTRSAPSPRKRRPFPKDAQPTDTLCPVCLAAVPAALVTEGETVSLQGWCSEHGEWRTPVWCGSPSFDSWCGNGSTATDATNASGAPATATTTAPADSPRAAAGSAAAVAPSTPNGADSDTDCPGLCGLCARHQQRTCTALFEVTQRCDLSCPVCFAESSPTRVPAEPSVAELTDMFKNVFAAQGAVNVQLSGGEPTMREDLPDIVRAACGSGFTFVQLNTNGLRLAREAGYAQELRDAGLASVFLQFDGVSDDTYRSLRGRPILAQKLRVLERCAEAGLAVVLVPTVVPGVNDDELGAMVRLAAQWPGVVRGLHCQPISYFGRYPGERRERLTLPEMLRAFEEQTDGEVQADDFSPSCCEHVRCSFRARYWVRDDGGLEPLRAEAGCCPPEPGGAARRAIAATSRQWSRKSPPSRTDDHEPEDSLSRFLESAGNILAISGMMFQDAWNIDMARVRRCCVHVATSHRGLVPFCLWNLTNERGQRLYPRC